MKTNKFWNLRNEASEAVLEIMGSIGDPKEVCDYWTGEEIDVGGTGTLRELADEIKELGSPTLLTVKIASEGGLVTVALAVHNMLAAMTGTRIVAQINGYCWSAATIIAMAADEIRMASNGSMMIHDAEAWGLCGDVGDLADAMKGMESLNRSMASAYLNKAGGTVEEWLTRMYDTTWLSGDQAKEIGLVDTLTDAVTITACGSAKDFAARYNAPSAIRAQVDSAPVVTPEPPQDEMTAAEITQLVADSTAKAIADAEAKQASAIAQATAKADELAAKLTAQEAKVTAAETELARIKALQDNGIAAATAAATADNKTATKAEPIDFSKLSAHELIRVGIEARKTV